MLAASTDKANAAPVGIISGRAYSRRGPPWELFRQHLGREAVAEQRLELAAGGLVHRAAAYDRKEGTLKDGAVTIHLTNDSTQDHNVAVADGDRVLGRSDTIKEAETDLRLDLQPGEYAFYCTVDAHRASGMEGTLTVR